MLAISVILGIIFGFSAALIAFVITWHEYEKHKFTGKRLLKKAFQAAIFTFVFFLISSFIIGFILRHFIINK